GKEGRVQHVFGAAPGAGSARAIVSRILMQGCIEAETKGIASTCVGHGRGDASAVADAALPPLTRRIGCLEISGKRGGAEHGLGAESVVDMEIQFGLPAI